MKDTISFILLFIGLVIAQAVIFNNLILFNVAMPFVLVYFIVRLPITLNVNWVLTFSFLLGLSVDIFSDTLGMNSLACTVTAFLRKPVFYLYVQKDDDLSGQCISMRTMGVAPFLKFLLSISLIYCMLLFTIEAFSFFDPMRLGLRILCSTAFTFIVISAIDTLTLRKREKRL